MKTRWVVIFCALAMLMRANEALQLLDQEADSSQSVFEQAARLPSLQKSLESNAQNLEPLNINYPSRWGNEIAPKFSTELSPAMVFSPRGLLEYQIYDRSLGRAKDISRSRVGFAVQSESGIEISVDSALSDSGEYAGIETLRASLPIGDNLFFSAGKYPPPFSTEYSRDPSVRWFPTMSPLAAQMAPASSVGFMVEGSESNVDWKLGWFGSDADRSVPSLEGDGYILASVATSRNRGGEGNYPQANYQRWHFDYIYNMDGMQSESISQGYRNIVSAGSEYSSGRFDFYTEVLAARSSVNTAYGVTAAGRYWLLQDKMSLVSRYQYARSRDPAGIVSYWGIPDTGSDTIFPTAFPLSTESRQLSSVYTGLNLHFDDDHFVIGTGIEYRSLSEIGEDDSSLSSWGWTTFVRATF